MNSLLKKYIPIWLLAFALGVIIGLCSCVTVHIPNRTRVANQMLREAYNRMQAFELSSRDVLRYVDSCGCSVPEAYQDSVYNHYLNQLK